MPGSDKPITVQLDSLLLIFFVFLPYYYFIIIMYNKNHVKRVKWSTTQKE